METGNNSVINLERMAWWRDSRFGMFIHWGLYAIPAGIWKGKEVPSLGEWIMRNGKIPISEYEKLAGQFNPVKFDADECARIAKQTGMKYLAITAKHHDGFCMYHSPSNPYNIVDATPYGKDVVMALSKACAKHGIKFCIYYSQSQDWHAPGGAGHWEVDKEKPYWESPVPPEEFAEYLRKKVKPQLTELLTQYGSIAVIWFDTPVIMTEEQSIELRTLVHKLQPDCLVSGRVGNNAGDFGSLGDNQLPGCPVKGDWETPATFNDTWGYKRNDRNWKSVKQLLCLLSDLAGKGVNYLLNIGPDASGAIPKPCINRLNEIGEWMKVNGKAIYGTSASPFPYGFDWGCMTQKGNTLYLLIMKWSGKITVNGFRNEVRHAKFLADPARKIIVIRKYDSKTDMHSVTLELGRKRPDRHVTVVELDLEGTPVPDTMPLQQPDGSISLFPHMAELHASKDNPKFGLTDTGLVWGWTETGSWLDWKFKFSEAGEYEAMIVFRGPGKDNKNKQRKGKTGQKVVLTIGDHTLRGVINPDERIQDFRTKYYPDYGCRLGRIKLDKPGIVKAELRAEDIPTDSWDGLPLVSVRILPIMKKGGRI